MTAATPLSLPLLRRALQLGQQNAITPQPIGLDLPRVRGGLDPASGLGHVPAIAVTALADEGPHFRKAAGELPRDDPPEAHLTEAGSVDQIAAVVERKHYRGHGRVLAPAELGADFPDFELEARLDRVQRTRLPSARRAGDHRDPPGQGRREGIDSLAGLHTRGIDDVPCRAAPGDEG